MDIREIKDILMNMNLPHFIANDICYKHGGVEHPIAEDIKYYWSFMRDEQNAFTKINLYTKEFIDDEGETRYHIKHNEETTDYPILHFPLLFNRCKV